MTPRSLLARVVGFHAEHGTIRTVGAVAGVCGRAVSERCGWLARTREEDRGRGYPRRVRVRAARHGLSAHSYLFMGLADADVHRYLTSNGPIGDLNVAHITPIHNKYTFQLLTEPYVDCLPTLYGTLEGGALTSPPGHPHGEEDLLSILERAGTLVLKPTTGGKGEGIYVLEREGSDLLVNGDPRTEAAVADLIASVDGYVATEFVEQHAYAEAIFTDATNTLRVFSILDPDTGEPHVLRVAHRFGSAVSAPTDNWSRGGFAAPVDVETGEIGRLVVLDGLRRSRPTRHPDTGTRIEGVTVPYWEEVRELVRDVADLHRLAPFVGWDVVVTDDGPVLIEGNARPGIDLLQLEAGVFEGRRVRQLLGG